MKPLNPFFVRIMPYLMIAFAILIFVLALFIFSYVLIAAVIIAFIVFIVGFIRTKFFGHPKNKAFHESFFIIQTNIKKDAESQTPTPEKTGRIIEHDESEKN